MTVVVTDLRTIINEADATTGWTPTGTLFTTDPDPAELTGCLGHQVSTATVVPYYTQASTNFVDTLVYVWVLPRGAMDTTANGGITLALGDGTDRLGYKVAGSDISAFRHDAGPVPWMCLMVDTGNLPASPVVYAGVAANLTLTAITQVGAGFKTLAKSVGGAANCWIDIMRYGTGGLRITGGTSGAPGLFSEIAAEDRLDTSGKAYGIIRQYAAGAYGVQGPLTWGDTAGTTATYFADKNVSVTWEDRGVRGGRYSCIVQGNATGSTTFQLGSKVGTGDSATGTDAVTLAMDAASLSSFTASDADLQFLKIYGSRMSGWRGGMTFSSNATNGPNHEFIGNVVDNSATIDFGRIVVRNCSFTNFYSTASTSAYINNWGANTNIKRCTFTFNPAYNNSSGFGAHAIRITSTGSYDFDGMAFTNYSTFNPGSFQTTADVNGTTDIITLDAAHGQTLNSFWPVFYQKRGGTAAIGLTDGTWYWLRAQTSTTVSVHVDANLAEVDSRINLTANGADTHWFEAAEAAVFNDSGGSVTINVVGTGGNTPSVRNSGTSSTTVVNAKTFRVSNVVPDSEVRIFTDDVNKTELAGVEAVANGTLTSVVLLTGGTGYTNGDTLTIVGGTKTSAATLTVTGVSSGVITSVSIASAGVGYSVAPTNPVSVTGGTGTGATFIANITGFLEYSYGYTTDIPVIIVVFHLNYKDIWQTGQKLTSTNQVIPVTQIGDRVYSNP